MTIIVFSLISVVTLYLGRDYFNPKLADENEEINEINNADNN